MEEKDRKLLENHVIESNAIENIFVEKSHHLFVDHMAAAEFVFGSALDSKTIARPESVHRILMRNELSEAGKFRRVGVCVGSNLKPPPEIIDKLIKRWWESLQEGLLDKSSLPRKQKEELAWYFHYWFEAILPFVDGNGRAGRLILNNVRLLWGLPWLIVYFSERQEYYSDISRWEMEHQKFFRG